MTDTYIFESPVGTLTLCVNERAVTALSYTPDAEPDLSRIGRTRSDILYEAYSELGEYFAGKRRSFEVPVETSGTPFQKSVWDALCEIPYGETRSYKDIAVRIGKPLAARAVGQANNKNPVMIIVPCHRVIGSGGALTGYACGLSVKEYLLEFEKGARG